MTTWLDITMPICAGMPHWPGDPDVVVERVADISRGEVCNVSRLVMGTHTGTHIDPPLHFYESGRSIDKMPPSVGIGPARVIHITSPQAITADELRTHGPKRGERLLFRTRNSDFAQDSAFREDYVYVAPDAAQLLADAEVALVGIDYMSIGAYGDEGEETHRILLGAGIWAIENLVLGRVEPGDYDLVCLPLLIKDGDGGPCRALLRPK